MKTSKDITFQPYHPNFDPFIVRHFHGKKHVIVIQSRRDGCVMIAKLSTRPVRDWMRQAQRNSNRTKLDCLMSSIALMEHLYGKEKAKEVSKWW